MKLFQFELAWATAAFDAILPERSALPHGLARMHPGKLLGDVIALSPFEQSIGLRAAIWLVALAPLFFLGRLRTITSLAPHERQRVLERLLSSPIYVIRQLCVGLKAMASLFFALSPAARAAMTTPVKRPFDSGLVTLRRRVVGEPHEHAAE